MAPLPALPLLRAAPQYSGHLLPRLEGVISAQIASCQSLRSGAYRLPDGEMGHGDTPSRLDVSAEDPHTRYGFIPAQRANASAALDVFPAHDAPK